MTEYERKKARHWGAPVPGHLKHGKGTYACQIYGCDCRLCLPTGRRKLAKGRPLTKAERQRRLREEKKGKPVPAGTKHGIYTYRTYGCRCDFCKAANRRQLHWARAERGIRARWRDEATGVWSTRDDVDVIHWPPAGEGEWTCPACGERFAMRRQQDDQAAA